MREKLVCLRESRRSSRDSHAGPEDLIFQPGSGPPSRGPWGMDRARLWVPCPQPRPWHLPAYLLDVLGSQVRFHLNKGFQGRAKMEKLCPKSCLLSQGIDHFLLPGPIHICCSRAGQRLPQGPERPRAGGRVVVTAGCPVRADALTRIVSAVDHRGRRQGLAVCGAPGEPWAWSLAVSLPSQHAVLSCLGAVVLSLSSTVLVPLVLKDELPHCPLMP